MATRYNYTGGIVTDGLVLHLDAAKKDSYPGSGTTWYDLSENGRNGTLTNGPTFSGVAKDAAVVFDGSNDYVTFGSANLILSDTYFTIECWMKSSDDGTGSGTNATFIGTRVGRNASLTIMGTSAAFFWDTIAEGNVNLSSSTNVTNQEWHHIVGTFDNGLGKIYVDGEYKNSTSSTAPIDLNDAAFGIGMDPNNINRTFYGKVPIGRVYNRALTASEITQNYNALKGRYGL